MDNISQSPKIFLSARWEHLLMLNYTVPAAILQPYIPPCTELDLWQGKAMVSMVGFMFKQTKVFGVKWPLHANFEEVNLRLYVKHFNGKEWKRGVAFISEIVPKHAIAFIANKLYNEHYAAMPTRHEIIETKENISAKYEWKHSGKWNKLFATADNKASLIKTGTEEEFIFEHYWGYNEFNKNTTIEYAVEHPRWEIYPITYHEAYFDINNLYGTAFQPYLSQPPQSIFLAKGSKIIVRKPVKIVGSTTTILP